MALRTALLRALAGAAALGCLGPGAAQAADPGITPVGHVETGTPVGERSSIADALSQAPARRKWVRLFHNWDGTAGGDAASVAQLEARVDGFDADGINVMVVVTRAGDPVINTAEGAARYGDYMGWLASHFAGRVKVWELWNEPDESHFWPDGPNAGAYTAMLHQAYPAIKAADPASQAIVGGLVGNDFAFLERLYDLGAGGSFDGVGVHTDTPCRIDAPDRYYREPDGRIGRFAFTGYREVHQTMADHGDGAKGIYMTEIGWTAADDLVCDEGANAGKRPKGVTSAEQASFLRQAFACTAADPYVRMVSWFTLQDHVPSSRFGLYDNAGSPRPALDALKSVGDGTGAGSDPECGAKVDRDKPSVTIEVPSLYYHRVTVKGAATDPTTPVRHIELWADGERIVKQPGATFERDWSGSAELSHGKHTVELRAYDDAGNVGVASAVIEHGREDGARSVKPAMKYKVKRKGRKLKVKAYVGPPKDGSFAEQPTGRLELRFERRTPRGWARSRISKSVRVAKIAHTYKMRLKGKWRAYGVLYPDAPYKRAKTRKYKFRVR